MKTVDDLRELIKASNGEIKIGSLKFSYQNGEDVDMFIDDNLFQWISSSEKGSASLADNDVVSGSSDIIEATARLHEAKKTVAALEEENNKLRSVSNEASLSVGKVAAYEALFLDKNVTITK